MKSIWSRLHSFLVQAYRTVFPSQRLKARYCRLFFAFALPLSWSVPSGLAQNRPSALYLAAAADLEPVLPLLAATYERQTGRHIFPTYGSSTTLTQQIVNGAPTDLFLSADCTHPQQIVNAHLAAPGGAVQYATGVLVLWARKDSPAQPLSLASLSNSKVTRIAVANEGHAPYGQAAMAELRSLNLLAALNPKLVTGENVMQTAQFADTGNAQAALISQTIASSPHFRETGTSIPLPRNYPPIRQCGVVLRRASNVAAAEAFLRWLTSPAVQGQLSAYGLEPAR